MFYVNVTIPHQIFIHTEKLWRQFADCLRLITLHATWPILYNYIYPVLRKLMKDIANQSYVLNARSVQVLNCSDVRVSKST